MYSQSGGGSLQVSRPLPAAGERRGRQSGRHSGQPNVHLSAHGQGQGLLESPQIIIIIIIIIIIRFIQLSISAVKSVADLLSFPLW